MRGGRGGYDGGVHVALDGWMERWMAGEGKGVTHTGRGYNGGAGVVSDSIGWMDGEMDREKEKRKGVVREEWVW